MEEIFLLGSEYANELPAGPDTSWSGSKDAAGVGGAGGDAGAGHLLNGLGQGVPIVVEAVGVEFRPVRRRRSAIQLLPQVGERDPHPVVDLQRGGGEWQLEGERYARRSFPLGGALR